MIEKEVLNRDVRLFSVNAGNPMYFLYACNLWRVMFTRKTFIVRCRFNYLDEIFSIDGNNLHVVWNECHNPSEYRLEEAIIKFFNCKIKRSWMVDISITNPSKIELLTYNIEFEFDDFWIKNE